MYSILFFVCVCVMFYRVVSKQRQLRRQHVLLLNVITNVSQWTSRPIRGEFFIFIFSNKRYIIGVTINANISIVVIIYFRIMDEVATVPSKRLRNKIAGFVTHLMKRIARGPVRGISLKLQVSWLSLLFML